jgi:ribosomal protein L11 methyltransferase
MTRYLEIRGSIQQIKRAATQLDELGCRASEERRDESTALLLAYAEIDAELSIWERALSQLFASEKVLPWIECKPLGREWELDWTRHLETVQLTNTLRVHPREPATAPEASELFLAPAFAFGFGEHPTTRLAARWLEQQLFRLPGARVLDVGCGTGVLSLVAAKLGAAHVVGLDTESQAVEAARRNAWLNGLSACCDFCQIDTAPAKADFDIVVANIEAMTLVSMAAWLARIASDCHLGLTGFLEEQANWVRDCFTEQSVRLVAASGEQGWTLLESKPRAQT